HRLPRADRGDPDRHAAGRLPRPGPAPDRPHLRGARLLGGVLDDVAGEPAARTTPGGGRTMTDGLTTLATRAGGTGEPIIECTGVEKWFGRFQALKGIDLTVGRQEVVVVIGPSGSGKSTLIRCINRLEEHDRGRIVVDGTELTNDVRNIAEVRREVGMVFQQ